MTNLQKTVLAAFCAAVVAACSSSNNATPSKPAAQKKLNINYTAIGASDAVGYGSTQPCTEASPALGAADPTCPEPGAAGYVPDIRAGFAQYGFVAALQDLGISGAVIGPDIQAMGNTYDPNTCGPRPAGDQIPANFLQNELPNVNPNATFVTIFAGGNDVNAIVTGLTCITLGGATAAEQTAFVTQQITDFGNDFAELAGGVHKTAPSATIVVANIPNFANVPYAFALSANPVEDAELRGALQQISVAIDTDVINTVASKGIPVVDLQCNPESYNPSNFYTDGFHPNDAGYALLAQQFLTAALSNYPSAPQSTCIWQGLSPSPGATPPASTSAASRILTRGTRGRFPVR